jgi:hypothetical protein
MNRSERCLCVNLAMWALLVPVVGSGFVLWQVLPGGVRRAGQATLWGISRTTWTDVHLWLTILFVALIVVHNLLHVEYLKQVPAKVRRR